jgi:hypothetical protein
MGPDLARVSFVPQERYTRAAGTSLSDASVLASLSTVIGGLHTTRRCDDVACTGGGSGGREDEEDATHADVRAAAATHLVNRKNGTSTAVGAKHDFSHTCTSAMRSSGWNVPCSVVWSENCTRMTVALYTTAFWSFCARATTPPRKVDG